MKPKDYNRDWTHLFKLDDDSPSGLVWNAPRLFKGTPNYNRVGKPVGSISRTKNNSYWVVGLGGDGSYLIHRIKWVMLNGCVSIDNDVDHIDGNGLNNADSNLREVVKSINSRNSKIRKDNTTGSICVSYTETNTSEGYQAQYRDLNGIVKKKFYSIRKYGNDRAFELACLWYDSNRDKIDGYTERHGKGELHGI